MSGTLSQSEVGVVVVKGPNGGDLNVLLNPTSGDWDDWHKLQPVHHLLSTLDRNHLENKHRFHFQEADVGKRRARRGTH